MRTPRSSVVWRIIRTPGRWVRNMPKGATGPGNETWYRKRFITEWRGVSGDAAPDPGDDTAEEDPDVPPQNWTKEQVDAWISDRRVSTYRTSTESLKKLEL